MCNFLVVSSVVVVCAVACGGDDSGGGRPGDAPPAPKDAASGTPEPITLTVTRNGQPVIGVHTYFIAADGSLGETVDTNSLGIASSIKADGGSVTALDPFVDVGQESNDLRTFMGVKAGDHLVLTQNDLSVEFTLTAPALGSADIYEVFTTCGSGRIFQGPDSLAASAPTGLVTLSGCNGTADILIIASSGEGDETGVKRGALYHPNVAVTGDSVDLTGDSYRDLQSVTFNYTNVPIGIVRIAASHSLASMRGSFKGLDQRLGNGAFVAGGKASFTILEPLIVGAVGVVDTAISARKTQHVISLGPAATTYAIDMSSIADKLLRNFVNRQEVYNATTKRLSWLEFPVGVAPDLTFAQIFVQRPVIGTSLAGPALPSWRWTIVAPYTPGEVKFPTLPTDVANWNPNLDDLMSIDTLFSAKVPGQYDLIRAHALDVVDFATPKDLAGPTGTVVGVVFND